MNIILLSTIFLYASFSEANPTSACEDNINFETLVANRNFKTNKEGNGSPEDPYYLTCKDGFSLKALDNLLTVSVFCKGRDWKINYLEIIDDYEQREKNFEIDDALFNCEVVADLQTCDLSFVNTDILNVYGQKKLPNSNEYLIAKCVDKDSEIYIFCDKSGVLKKKNFILLYSEFTEENVRDDCSSDCETSDLIDKIESDGSNLRVTEEKELFEHGGTTEAQCKPSMALTDKTIPLPITFRCVRGEWELSSSPLNQTTNCANYCSFSDLDSSFGIGPETDKVFENQEFALKCPSGFALENSPDSYEIILVCGTSTWGFKDSDDIDNISDLRCVKKTKCELRDLFLKIRSDRSNLVVTFSPKEYKIVLKCKRNYRPSVAEKTVEAVCGLSKEWEIVYDDKSEVPPEHCIKDSCDGNELIYKDSLDRETVMILKIGAKTVNYVL